MGNHRRPLSVGGSVSSSLLFGNVFKAFQLIRISRWQRRRLTLISPTQRLERQRPKFSPASKPEWRENLQKRHQKKTPPLLLQRRKKSKKRRLQRRSLTSTWTTQR